MTTMTTIKPKVRYALSSSPPSEGHHLGLMRQRYGADVAVFENRASALSCSFNDGNPTKREPIEG